MDLKTKEWYPILEKLNNPYFDYYPIIKFFDKNDIFPKRVKFDENYCYVRCFNENVEEKLKGYVNFKVYKNYTDFNLYSFKIFDKKILNKISKYKTSKIIKVKPTIKYWIDEMINVYYKNILRKYYIFDPKITNYDYLKYSAIIADLEINENCVRFSPNCIWIFKTEYLHRKNLSKRLKKYFKNIEEDQYNIKISFKEEIENFKRLKKLERILKLS